MTSSCQIAARDTSEYVEITSCFLQTPASLACCANYTVGSEQNEAAGFPSTAPAGTLRCYLSDSEATNQKLVSSSLVSRIRIPANGHY